MDLVNGWLSARTVGGFRAKPQMAHIAETWEKTTALRARQTYNPERKPLVFSVFGPAEGAARD